MIKHISRNMLLMLVIGLASSFFLSSDNGNDDGDGHMVIVMKVVN